MPFDTRRADLMIEDFVRPPSKDSRIIKAGRIQRCLYCASALVLRRANGAFAASRSKKFIGNLRSIRPEQLGHRLGEDQPSGFELDGLSRLDELIERMARRRMNAVGKKIRPQRGHQTVQGQHRS